MNSEEERATGLSKSCLLLLRPLRSPLSSPPPAAQSSRPGFISEILKERPDSRASGINTSKIFPHGLTGDSRRSCLEHLVSRGHRAVLSGAPEEPGHVVRG